MMNFNSRGIKCEGGQWYVMTRVMLALMFRPECLHCGVNIGPKVEEFTELAEIFIGPGYVGRLLPEVAAILGGAVTQYNPEFEKLRGYSIEYMGKDFLMDLFERIIADHGEWLPLNVPSRSF